ncbi:MAG: SDR family oxidoreductase [Chloroflexi bacterium]|nr:SDR family oxidoreductase [Chloroflexota bacterium]
MDNKVVVLVGGNGYLGRKFSRAILEFGAVLYVLDINTTESQEIVELKEKYENKFRLLRVDCTNKEEIVKARELILKKEQDVDVLINMSTLRPPDYYRPFEEVSLEGWNVGLLGNLTIPFLTIQSFIPIMVKQQRGSIVNIASHYGIVGNDQRIYRGANLGKIYVTPDKDTMEVHAHGVYNAAKGGLINFTRYLAAYYGKDNIRVNSISPGGIFQKDENETFVRNYGERTPLGRKARPDEINGAVIFLASDASTYVTGHNLVVDGGWTCW